MMASIMASGGIVSLIAILQFILVSLLGIVPKETSIDLVRRYAGTARAAGASWDRATSILISPNELGVFLSVCLLITLAYYWSAARRSGRAAWLLLIALLAIGLLASMSRSSIIGAAVGVTVLALVKRQVGPILALGAASLVVVAFAAVHLELLYERTLTASDPYFTHTLQEAMTSKWVWSSPVLGRGYGLTRKVAERLGVEEGILILGGVDIYATQAISQVGLVGLGLFMLAWSAFVWNAYRAARRRSCSAFARATAAGICAALVAMMVTSAHAAAWEYVSFAAGYYAIGGIAVWLAEQCGAAQRRAAAALEPREHQSPRCDAEAY